VACRVSRLRIWENLGRFVVSRSVALNSAVTAVREQYLFARFDSGAVGPLAPMFPEPERLKLRSRLRGAEWRW